MQIYSLISFPDYQPTNRPTDLLCFNKCVNRFYLHFCNIKKDLLNIGKKETFAASIFCGLQISSLWLYQERSSLYHLSIKDVSFLLYVTDMSAICEKRRVTFRKFQLGTGIFWEKSSGDRSFFCISVTFSGIFVKHLRFDFWIIAGPV